MEPSPESLPFFPLLVKNFSRLPEDRLTPSDIETLRGIRTSVSEEEWKRYEALGRAEERRRRKERERASGAGTPLTAPMWAGGVAPPGTPRAHTPVGVAPAGAGVATAAIPSATSAAGTRDTTRAAATTAGVAPVAIRAAAAPPPPAGGLRDTFTVGVTLAGLRMANVDPEPDWDADVWHKCTVTLSGKTLTLTLLPSAGTPPVPVVLDLNRAAALMGAGMTPSSDLPPCPSPFAFRLVLKAGTQAALPASGDVAETVLARFAASAWSVLTSWYAALSSVASHQNKPDASATALPRGSTTTTNISVASSSSTTHTGAAGKSVDAVTGTTTPVGTPSGTPTLSHARITASSVPVAATATPQPMPVPAATATHSEVQRSVMPAVASTSVTAHVPPLAMLVPPSQIQSTPAAATASAVSASSSGVVSNAGHGVVAEVVGGASMVLPPTTRRRRDSDSSTSSSLSTTSSIASLVSHRSVSRGKGVAVSLSAGSSVEGSAGIAFRKAVTQQQSVSQPQPVTIVSTGLVTTDVDVSLQQAPVGVAVSAPAIADTSAMSLASTATGSTHTHIHSQVPDALNSRTSDTAIAMVSGGTGWPTVGGVSSPQPMPVRAITHDDGTAAAAAVVDGPHGGDHASSGAVFATRLSMSQVIGTVSSEDAGPIHHTQSSVATTVTTAQLATSHPPSTTSAPPAPTPATAPTSTSASVVPRVTGSVASGPPALTGDERPNPGARAYVATASWYLKRKGHTAPSTGTDADIPATNEPHTSGKMKRSTSASASRASSASRGTVPRHTNSNAGSGESSGDVDRRVSHSFSVSPAASPRRPQTHTQPRHTHASVVHTATRHPHSSHQAHEREHTAAAAAEADAVVAVDAVGSDAPVKSSASATHYHALAAHIHQHQPRPVKQGHLVYLPSHPVAGMRAFVAEATTATRTATATATSRSRSRSRPHSAAPGARVPSSFATPAPVSHMMSAVNTAAAGGEWSGSGSGSDVHALVPPSPLVDVDAGTVYVDTYHGYPYVAAPISSHNTAAPSTAAATGTTSTGTHAWQQHARTRSNSFHRSLGIPAPSASATPFLYHTGYERPGWTQAALGSSQHQAMHSPQMSSTGTDTVAGATTVARIPSTRRMRSPHTHSHTHHMSRGVSTVVAASSEDGGLGLTRDVAAASAAVSRFLHKIAGASTSTSTAATNVVGGPAVSHSGSTSMQVQQRHGSMPSGLVRVNAHTVSDSSGPPHLTATGYTPHLYQQQHRHVSVADGDTSVILHELPPSPPDGDSILAVSTRRPSNATDVHASLTHTPWHHSTAQQQPQSHAHMAATHAPASPSAHLDTSHVLASTLRLVVAALDTPTAASRTRAHAPLLHAVDTHSIHPHTLSATTSATPAVHMLNYEYASMGAVGAHHGVSVSGVEPVSPSLGTVSHIELSHRLSTVSQVARQVCNSLGSTHTPGAYINAAVPQHTAAAPTHPLPTSSKLHSNSASAMAPEVNSGWLHGSTVPGSEVIASSSGTHAGVETVTHSRLRSAIAAAVAPLSQHSGTASLGIPRHTFTALPDTQAAAGTTVAFREVQPHSTHSLAGTATTSSQGASFSAHIANTGSSDAGVPVSMPIGSGMSAVHAHVASLAQQVEALQAWLNHSATASTHSQAATAPV